MMKNFEALRNNQPKRKGYNFETDSQKKIEEIMNESDWTSRR